MRWRALGQRLLRRGAIRVRDGADRVLIRLRARDASIEADLAPGPVAPDSREDADRDRLAAAASGGDGVPEHWRARVRTGPPRHWLERVEAARRTFKAAWIDAAARSPVPFPVEPAGDSSSLESTGRRPHPSEGAVDSSSAAPPPRHSRKSDDAEYSPPVEPPRHRPRPLEGVAPDPPPRRTTAAREEEPPAPARRRPAAALDRESANPQATLRPAETLSVGDTAPQRSAPTQRAPAVRGSEPLPRAERFFPPAPEPDRPPVVRPRRPPLPPVEPLPPGSTPPRRAEVQPPQERRNAREDNTSEPRPVSGRHPFRWDPAVTSSEPDDLAWTGLVAPVREYRGVERPPPRPAEPDRSREAATGGQPAPESTRSWPTFLPPDPWQRSMAPAPQFDVAEAPRVDASDEAFFYTNEPADRWPALPDAPTTADEDWSAMKHRLERLDRLDREQRGW